MNDKRANRFARQPVIGSHGQPAMPIMNARQTALVHFVARNRFRSFKDMHAFMGGDPWAIRRNIRLLRSETVGYIKQCEQDVAAHNHLKDVHYEIDDRGVVFLHQQGLIAENFQRPIVTNFFHATLATHATASIEAGIASCEYASLIDWMQIRTSNSIPRKTAEALNPFGIPYGLDGETHKAVADSPPFGIKLALSDRLKFRFFPGVEADMGTKKESQIIEQFRGYLTIEQELGYTSHFGFPEGTFFVPFLVKSLYQINRVEWMKRILSEMTHGKGSKTIMFMAHREDAPSGYLFTEPWQRVGHADVTLNR